jgi:magnesium transporter
MSLHETTTPEIDPTSVRPETTDPGVDGGSVPREGREGREGTPSRAHRSVPPNPGDWAEPSSAGTADALLERWPHVPEDERVAEFRKLGEGVDDEFFLSLSTDDQADLLRLLPAVERRLWLRVLAPDDAADVIQHFEAPDRPALMAMLDDATRREVAALLAYQEDQAGGLMSPRFARLRSDMSVGEALRYLRRQANAGLETIYYAYVLDSAQRLIGVVSFRELFGARDSLPVSEVMRTDYVSVAPDTDQETVAQLIARHDLVAVPVVDADRVLRGIVTVDDIVDVVQEEASEDIHKLGGMEALDLPYLQNSLRQMLQKRAGWLSALFLGEMLTATAMARYEADIAQAVVLAVFVPLIISSGGNSGSQATTLIIRALALGEITPRDASRVIGRELASGLGLGAILGLIGFLRVLVWQVVFPGVYGEHFVRIALTVGSSLVGVVMWGTLSGALLPLLIRRLGFDPASASAPFVATLVDVTGLVIYFTMAHLFLGGILL